MKAIEKLREYADATKWGGECRILHAHHGDFAGECSERECDDCRSAYLRAIADEIERDRADSPKVLDADGEPLEVGDRVWWTWGGQEYVVEQVRSSEEVYVTLANGEFSGQSANPRDLTRHRPVLDADGVPIKVGDTVWDVENGFEFEVSRVDGCSVTMSNGGYYSSEFARYHPSILTHAKPEPPDTWERIEEDATLSPREYYARYVGHDVGLKDDEEVNGAFVKSLVRRCRALAEKEAGR